MLEKPMITIQVESDLLSRCFTIGAQPNKSASPGVSRATPNLAFLTQARLAEAHSREETHWPNSLLNIQTCNYKTQDQPDNDSTIEHQPSPLGTGLAPVSTP